MLAGLPAHGAEIDGRTNPLELGLLDQIDFDKGCYVGQEVIARLANYEKIQRRLVRLRSEPALVPGTELQPKTSVGAGRRPRSGRITTVAEQQGWLALALVPLATRAGDTLYAVTEDPASAGSGAGVGTKAARMNEVVVVDEIGRLPE